MTGIDALSKWSEELEPSVIIPHYKHVLPYLNDYLKSSGTDGKPHCATMVTHGIRMISVLLIYKLLY